MQTIMFCLDEVEELQQGRREMIWSRWLGLLICAVVELGIVGYIRCWDGGSWRNVPVLTKHIVVCEVGRCVTYLILECPAACCEGFERASLNHALGDKLALAFGGAFDGSCAF